MPMPLAENYSRLQTRRKTLCAATPEGQPMIQHLEPMGRGIGIAVTGMLSMLGMTAIDMQSGTAGLIGLEKLGVATVTVALLLWLYRQERTERIANRNKYDSDMEQVRKTHARALGELKTSIDALTEALRK
jgi:hypothetical protein